MPKFEVRLVYAGVVGYSIEAENEEEAKKKALQRFSCGDENDFGISYENVDKIEVEKVK